MKRLKKKVKRLVKGVNEFERELERTVDAMFQDRGINGLITVDEVGKNYLDLLREDLKERKRRKRRKKS